MKINEKQTKRIQSIQNQIQELNKALQSYLTGIADGLEVPENYVFNFDKMEFEPAEKPTQKPHVKK